MKYRYTTPTKIQKVYTTNTKNTIKCIKTTSANLIDTIKAELINEIILLRNTRKNLYKKYPRLKD